MAASCIGRSCFEEPDRVVDPPSWLEHIPFAFWIVDALRPAVLVELGTQSGNSYASFAQAVQTLGLPTACYAVDTWQGDSQAGFYDERVFAEWAAYHDRHFAAFSRLIRSTFDEAAEHFPDGSIDLLHIDGCHTYESVSADFERWRPKLSRRGVILLHDINVRERDFGAWRSVLGRIRYSGLSVAYMLSGLLGSAITPAITVWLLDLTGQSSSIAWYIIVAAGLSFAALFMLAENRLASIDAVDARQVDPDADPAAADAPDSQPSVARTETA